MDEILKVEKELECFNEIIDLFKGKMNCIDYLDVYVMIMIYFWEW